LRAVRRQRRAGAFAWERDLALPNDRFDTDEHGRYRGGAVKDHYFYFPGPA